MTARTLTQARLGILGWILLPIGIVVAGYWACVGLTGCGSDARTGRKCIGGPHSLSACWSYGPRGDNEWQLWVGRDDREVRVPAPPMPDAWKWPDMNDRVAWERILPSKITTCCADRTCWPATSGTCAHTITEMTP